MVDRPVCYRFPMRRDTSHDTSHDMLGGPDRGSWGIAVPRIRLPGKRIRGNGSSDPAGGSDPAPGSDPGSARPRGEDRSTVASGGEVRGTRLPGKRIRSDSTPGSPLPDGLGSSEAVRDAGVTGAAGDTGPAGAAGDIGAAGAAGGTGAAGDIGAVGRDTRAWRTEAEEDRRIRAETAEVLGPLLARAELLGFYRIRSVAERFGLTVHEYTVLAELLLARRAMTGAEVAETVGLATGGTTRLLARLEERDLIEREPDPEDGRRLLVLASARAHEILWKDVTDTGARRIVTGVPGEWIDWFAPVTGRILDVAVRRFQEMRDHQYRDRVRRRRQRAAER